MVTSFNSSISNNAITLIWMVGYSTCVNVISLVFNKDPLYTSQPPHPSTRPPVTGYKIYHNTTGSAMLNFTCETQFIIEGVMPGVYFFTVLAVNVLGDGKEKSTSIMS